MIIAGEYSGEGKTGKVWRVARSSNRCFMTLCSCAPDTKNDWWYAARIEYFIRQGEMSAVCMMFKYIVAFPLGSC